MRQPVALVGQQLQRIADDAFIADVRAHRRDEGLIDHAATPSADSKTSYT